MLKNGKNYSSGHGTIQVSEDILFITNNLLEAIVLQKLIEKLNTKDFVHIKPADLLEETLLYHCSPTISNTLKRLVQKGFLDFKSSKAKNNYSKKSLYKINAKNMKQALKIAKSHIKINETSSQETLDLEKEMNTTHFSMKTIKKTPRQVLAELCQRM